jgi:cysteine desulfurase
MRTIYLDYAAATPLDKRVFAAMEPYLTETFYNPSAAYQAARVVRAEYEEARHRLAMVIGGRQSEIIMTAGATESVNIALHGVMKRYGGTVVTTAIEHPAVLEAAKQFDHVIVKSTPVGSVVASSIAQAITDDTTLVSVGYANSELGTIQPLKDIAHHISEVRQDRLRRGLNHPIYFHTDASQAAGHLDLSVARLGVDLMTLNAGKCYGPKQVGLLWVRAEVLLTPFVYGGGQERGLRSGTENVAGTIGFATALTRVEKRRKTTTQQQSVLRDKLERALVEAIPDLVVNGNVKKRLPNHLHISVPGLDGERALFALDERGVMVATGSACAANKGTRSRVLEAVGMSDEMADGSLRITLGDPTIEEEIDSAAQAIIEVVQQERGK